jgi:hypothetical protein
MRRRAASDRTVFHPGPCGIRQAAIVAVTQNTRPQIAIRRARRMKSFPLILRLPGRDMAIVQTTRPELDRTIQWSSSAPSM